MSFGGFAMVRHPVDIALSWNQFRVTGGRAGTSLECNLLRRQHLMLSVLEALDGEPATLFAEYEAVTGDPPARPRLPGRNTHLPEINIVRLAYFLRLRQPGQGHAPGHKCHHRTLG